MFFSKAFCHIIIGYNSSDFSMNFESTAELYTKRMFELLLSGYSIISIQDTALFLGMNEDDATKCKIPSFFIKLVFYMNVHVANRLCYDILLFA